MNAYQKALYTIASYILKRSTTIPKGPQKPVITQSGDYTFEIKFRELSCSVHPGYEDDHYNDVYYKETEIQNELNFLMDTLPENYKHPSLSATCWIDDDGYGIVTVGLYTE